jgi:hypothetical protein
MGMKGSAHVLLLILHIAFAGEVTYLSLLLVDDIVGSIYLSEVTGALVQFFFPNSQHKKTKKVN